MAPTKLLKALPHKPMMAEITGEIFLSIEICVPHQMVVVQVAVLPPLEESHP